MKNIFKIKLIAFIFLFLFAFPLMAGASILKDTSDLDPTSVNNQTGKFVAETGFQTGSGSDIGSLSAMAIKVFLGLLGIIFLVLFVLAGYKYMTARGNEEKVEESLHIMQRAIIGLVIVIAAYSITYVVFNSIEIGGGSGGEYGPPSEG